MSTHKKTYQTDHLTSRAQPGSCRKVTLYVETSGRSEDDGQVDRLYLIDEETGEEIDLESAPPALIAEVEDLAQEIAYENAYEDWFERQCAMAEAWAEAREDR